MLSRDGIYCRVCRVVIAELGVPQRMVTQWATIHGDLSADSLKFMGLVMALENEFGIEIPESTIDKMGNKQTGGTVRGIARLIRRQILS